MWISCIYKLPGNAIKRLNSYLENVLKKTNTENIFNFVVGDFNMNYVDYNKNV